MTYTVSSGTLNPTQQQCQMEHWLETHFHNELNYVKCNVKPN